MAPHTTYSVRKLILRFLHEAIVLLIEPLSISKKTGSIGPKPRTGRRPKANERSTRNLFMMATICPRLSARQLKND